MRDLVTGGAGFIGSHLAEELVRRGRRLRVVDNLSGGHIRNLDAVKDSPAFEFVRADIAEPGVAESIVEGCERVFHMAALADIVPSIERPQPYFRSNVDGTVRLLEACRAKNIKRLVYAASSSCYGLAKIFPTPETAPIDTQYPYAFTKYLGELSVLHWSKIYDLPAVCLRLFNVYGPRVRTTGTYGAVFGVFLAQLLAGKPLTIVGDGTQTRDFTFVTDVVAAFIAAADSTITGEIMNIGTGNPQSVNTLVKLLGTKDIVHIPKRPGEPDCTMADASKARRLLKWEPKVDFPAGVKEMLRNIEYWRDAPVWEPATIAAATSTWFRHLTPTNPSSAEAR